MAQTKMMTGIKQKFWCGCDELRCECGSLVARIVAKGVELKCRRCKRLIVVPLYVRKNTP